MKSITEAYVSIYEHDEQYPKDIKNMSVSSLLEQLKTKSEEDYHAVEAVIEKHFLSNQQKNDNFESKKE